MSRQQRKRIWVVVALLVALIVALLIYLLIISFLGSDTYVQFISFDVDEMFFVIPVCIYTTYTDPQKLDHKLRWIRL